MKKYITLLVGLLAFFALGAASPTYTSGPDTLWRLQVDPTFNADGTVSTNTVTAFYKATFTNTIDPTDHFDKALGSVAIDCVKDAAKTVTVSGKTYTYAEIATAMAAAAAQEWKAANP